MTDYTQYDRVVDILLYLTDQISLCFNVVLSRKPNGERKFFHYEIAKQSAQRGGGNLYNMKRIMNFFFTIDVKNDFTSSFILRPRDVQMLNDIIDKNILPWYQAGSDRYAFQIVDDMLALTEYKPVIYTQSEIQYLQFEPCVMQDYKSEKYTFGINMNISGKYTIQIELDKFMDLVYLLHSDMYSAACSICTYVKTQPYNINVFSPYGLGGGRIDDFAYAGADDNIQASYTDTIINSSGNNQSEKKGNSFLDSLGKKKE